ncbi:MAG TPA: AmmeMemoRadiSam system protein A [Terriglobales bacterium]|nr:AmmeMemoRadiSam system protein A [Terriglobales bacterium]
MSQQPENPRPAQSPTTSEAAETAAEFSPEERLLLLGLAHQSIETALAGRELALDPPTPHLAEPRGVFTTLYIRSQLRGCVGYVFPASSVYRAVGETARAAAFEDTRFFPVTQDEAPLLEVHLSILSALKPIDPQQVEVGRHGLLVTMAGQRGLLLPQVPVEYGWDRVTFLEQTCRKAGLPMDAWKHGATFEAFTAEVFGESSTSGRE